MKEEEVKTLFESFANMNVLVIGDAMVDAYVWGKAERTSPEANVPVIEVEKRENRMGGAANVALNIQALGAKPILCSVIGNDQQGQLFNELLGAARLSNSGIVMADGRTTTTKTRIINNQKHILRVDEEITDDIDDALHEMLLAKINSTIGDNQVDVIVFQDYDKGVLTGKIIKETIRLANDKRIPTAADPKRNNFHQYRGASLFKPNLKELTEGLDIELSNHDGDEFYKHVNSFRAKQDIKAVITTLSEDGIFFCDKNGHGVIPAHKRSVTDVSGAGDTVISVAALCLAAGLQTEQIAALSNLSGGMVCEEVGVAPIDKSRLQNEAQALAQ